MIKTIIRRLAGLVPLEFRQALKGKLKSALKPELKIELMTELVQVIGKVLKLPHQVAAFCDHISTCKVLSNSEIELAATRLRQLVHSCAALDDAVPVQPNVDELRYEIAFLKSNAEILRPAFEALRSQRVLFCGQAYYNAWYLSRKLRDLGWKADVYNWDENPSAQIYYHGQDFHLGQNVPATLEACLEFYLLSLYGYDVLHFSNANGITFGWRVQNNLKDILGEGGEIRLLKALGKKIVYSNNGCQDGVSQSAFAQWGPESVCAICRWQHEPTVCSDERNLAWGRFRNEVSDFQCLLGGNRVDFNDDLRVHEVPEFYCLNPEIWNPGIEVPEKYRLPALPEGTVRLYHAVGHRKERTRNDGVNIKSTHVYLPLIEKLRAEGMILDLIEPTGIPNKEVRFLQMQADIFLDMLTFGWFGANAREAMMLAKPVICFIRPEWLESVREEIPDYAAELPIVSATPHTVEAVLRDLIANPAKRRRIGERSQAFALKWHSDTAAGKRFNYIYTQLLSGNPLLRERVDFTQRNE